MKQLVVSVVVCVVVQYVTAIRYHNETRLSPVNRQLSEFLDEHPKPIGVYTRLTGDPLDIRDTVTLNTNIFDNKNLFLETSHLVRERIPERVVHAKGYGAFGYFEVTHDVSQYTKADVFNGIGKKTPLVGRFSTAIENLGGSDLLRETRALALKMYTKEGNLDFLCLHLPIFLYNEPLDFTRFLHTMKRNPRTNLFDSTQRWDFFTLKPQFLHTILWLQSDFGLPAGYRKMDIFPLHVYEIYNKHGDRYFVKFNFRTTIGLANLTDAQAAALNLESPDYFNIDLYNAIAEKNYPSWRLEMDILTKEDLKKVDYDPFDLTRLWKRGTYRTVTIGRIVFNDNVDNTFKDIEQLALNPDNLVPGILGPHDEVFKSRRIFYPDAQNYRLGGNHHNIQVNAPLYDKTYNRDGVPPVKDNMKYAPNYYPNSFHGPMPYVDEARPTEMLKVLHSNAIDLQPLNEFYNEIVDTDAHRQRIADHLAESLVNVPTGLQKRAIYILTLIDIGLGRRVKNALQVSKNVDRVARRNQIAECIANVDEASKRPRHKLQKIMFYNHGRN
ncbi:catalase-like [Spodoptera litura]|uniref:Catalase-like n=1 Tax=Spodoptera litura TaxID=69820 RepID=A0A9J7IX30_SPOLT|nr:catalase-like [Spodoptera litura]